MRAFWPREHGAYGQLGAPLAAALCARVPTAAAALLAAGAALAFVAHEPLLVLRGHRGKRAREAAPDARRWLAATATAAVAAGGAGLALAPAAALAVAGAVLVPAAIGLALAWRRAEHNLVGEVVAATALAGAAAPVAVASGASWQHAATVWAGWAVGFAATVVAVHRVIARNKGRGGVVDVVAGVAIAAIAVAGGVAVARLPAASACMPLAALSAALVLRPPKASRLRAIGVALAIASAAAAALVVALGG